MGLSSPSSLKSLSSTATRSLAVLIDTFDYICVCLEVFCDVHEHEPPLLDVVLVIDVDLHVYLEPGGGLEEFNGLALLVLQVVDRDGRREADLLGSVVLTLPRRPPSYPVS
jgi:hypothetical protein